MSELTYSIESDEEVNVTMTAMTAAEASMSLEPGTPSSAGEARGGSGADFGQTEIRLLDQARSVADLWSQHCGHLTQLRTVHRSLAECSSNATGRRKGQIRTRPSDTRALPTLQCRAVAGVLLGQASVASALGVSLEIDPRTNLTRLPTTLDESAAVTILGNLIANAFDAVHELIAERRSVAVLVSDAGGGLLLRVRDQGVGMADLPDSTLMEPGFSTKGGHTGLGLDIVSRLAAEAGGSLSIQRHLVGTTVKVSVPHA